MKYLRKAKTNKMFITNEPQNHPMAHQNPWPTAAKCSLQFKGILTAKMLRPQRKTRNTGLLTAA